MVLEMSSDFAPLLDVDTSSSSTSASGAGGVGRCRWPLRGIVRGIVTHALNQLSEAAEGWEEEGG